MRCADSIGSFALVVATCALSVLAGLDPARADAALSAGSRIGPNGVGPIVIGTTPVQAAATGTRFTATAPAPGSSCYYMQPLTPAGVTFLVEFGTLRRVEVRVRGLATTDGFRVGDPLAKLRAFYRTRARLAPDKYDPNVATLTLDPASAVDVKYRTIFRIEGGSVSAIYSGALPQVAYVESCS